MYEELKLINGVTVISRFTSLIRSSKTARKAKSIKTKINFPLLPKKRRREQRSVYERKETRTSENWLVN
jgi:hypothetical protein